MPQRIPSCIEDIPFYIHPESHEEVNNDRGTQGHEGHIDKVLAYGGSSDAHLFADGGTYPKHMPLNKMFKPVHTAKLKTFSSKNKGFIKCPGFSKFAFQFDDLKISRFEN